MGLPARRDDAAQHRDHEQAACDRGGFVALSKLFHSITRRIRARLHRKAAQIASDVLRELLSGDVALLRILLERLADDVVEIADKLARKSAMHAAGTGSRDAGGQWIVI